VSSADFDGHQRRCAIMDRMLVPFIAYCLDHISVCQRVGWLVGVLRHFQHKSASPYKTYSGEQQRRSAFVYR